ncbi:phage virion morphogenesis protein [Flavobacterium psychrophilum]|uniref:hypothetical protein n=1 Tax=Flavobacterium psychrophilum TaxID=96345 RepID=UPI000B7C5333|nr:hypothetical protein [Flavobacterium psychrophilum]EKT3967140.1 hypothetical protein [Flavobacterium psychrophilum]MBF2024359.1 hypothetical protein [Flavobacterium psychrophilum]MCB5983189.1 hypothetical protein [Flavobacterium psychrophilum]MCB5995435.1 hypothetical protein [Flavobacterium psychrophilum]MCB5997773.1 hypothetical protein [Flavobacterium psychrophilum]
MTPEEFEKALQTKAREVENYAKNTFPSTAGNITLRFINGNFRAGGFQGATFKKWKKGKGTPLVKTGALRSANYYTTQQGQVTIKNNMPYAKVHNEGFKGTVNIAAHTRQKHRGDVLKEKYTNKKGLLKTRTIKLTIGEDVKAHTRKMNIPQRQFMPINQNDSPVLNNAIQRQVTNDLKNIFNQ